MATLMSASTPVASLKKIGQTSTTLRHPLDPTKRANPSLNELAWEWNKERGKGIELSTVHPFGVYGPLLSRDYPTSVQLVEWLMNGNIPMIPQIGFSVIDIQTPAPSQCWPHAAPKTDGTQLDGPEEASLFLQQGPTE